MSDDPTRDMLYPPDAKPSNPHRHGAIVYNAYERQKPLRYEVQHEALRMNGRPIVDPGFCLFDIFWRARINYNKNERPIWLEMSTRNAAYRRELAMYDEARTGHPAALLGAQEALNEIGDAAEHLGHAMVVATQSDMARPLGFDGAAFCIDLDMAIKRHLRPLLAQLDAKMRDGRERLIEHARRKPKLWETPLDMAPALGYRWRIEGDLLAVVALEPPPGLELPVSAYATRRRPYRPYRGLREAPMLAAERAAEIAKILAEDSSEGVIGRGRLLHDGAHWLDRPYVHADQSRTTRDIRRAVSRRILRAKEFARVDMTEAMIEEAIDYVIGRSREREVRAAD